MQTNLNTTIRCALAGAAILAAGAVHARNDKLLLPLDAALRSQSVRQVLAADVQLRFGKTSAQGVEVLSTAAVHGVADPFGGINYNSGGGTRSRRSDEAVCLDAFRKAVLDLQQRARQVGATGVLGIVSNYNSVEVDSAAVYECHIGHTRGVVDLKGHLVRAVNVAAAAAVAPMATARAMPVQPAGVVMAPPQHIATGYAALDDVDALPYLSDRGRAAYKEYVTRPTPKAFAISPNGHWFSAWTLVPTDATMPTDPTERALVGCQRSAQVPCKLYAINGSVVWVKDAR